MKSSNAFLRLFVDSAATPGKDDNARGRNRQLLWQPTLGPVFYQKLLEALGLWPGQVGDVMLELNPTPHIISSLLLRLSKQSADKIPRWLGTFTTNNPGKLGCRIITKQI